MIFLPKIVWAWGSVGHRTVGTVAERFLSPAVQRELAKYLQEESLGEVSNWADSIKATPEIWGHSKWYHFESVPDGSTYLKSKKAMAPDERKLGGTIEALLEAQRIFLSSKTTRTEKTNALKFIVHFIGDIHQPLHSGRPEDNGGNKIPIKWNDHNTNLHAVWDTYIIQEAYEEISKAQAKQISDEDYADHLLDKFAGVSPGKFDDFNAWLVEAISYRSAAYQYKDESAKAYTRRFIHAVDSQIYRAGVRLAAVLTRLVKQQGPTSTQMNLRSAIESISGPLSSFIFLRPQKNQDSKGYIQPNLFETEVSCDPFSGWAKLQQ